MKRLISIVVMVFLICLATQVGAQVSIGVVGGLNFSDFKGEGTSVRDVSSHTVFGAGAILDLRLTRHLHVCMEPMYIQKHGTAEQIDYENPAIDVLMAFVELPIFFKYSFGNTIKPYLMAGPTLGYLINAELGVTFAGLSFEADAKHVFNNLDLGAGFGAGVEVPVGKFRIFMEGRYTLGLVNLNKGGDVEAVAGPIVIQGHIDESDKIKRRGVQVMAGMTIPLGRE